MVLLDTCAFSSAKEDESVRLVQDRHARARADAKVIATGCMAAINPQRLRSCFPEDVFSPRDEGRLARILGLDGHHDAQPLIAGFYDPRWLRRHEECLARLLARGRIRWLQVPIQSGSDRVLSLMHRGYR